MLKKLTSNHLVMIVAAAAVLYVIMNYSNVKSTLLSGMTNSNSVTSQSNVQLTNFPASSAPLTGA